MGLLCALAAGAQAGLAFAGETLYRICRDVHRAHECVSLDSACAHASASGGTRPGTHSCEPISKARCEAFQALLRKGFDLARALPESQRIQDGVSTRDCAGFSLAVPGHSVTACIGRQPAGARALSDLWNLSEEICDAR